MIERREKKRGWRVLRVWLNSELIDCTCELLKLLVLQRLQLDDVKFLKLVSTIRMGPYTIYSIAMPFSSQVPSCTIVGAIFTASSTWWRMSPLKESRIFCGYSDIRRNSTPTIQNRRFTQEVAKDDWNLNKSAISHCPPDEALSHVSGRQIRCKTGHCWLKYELIWLGWRLL
jgi:hypothetical protein